MNKSHSVLRGLGRLGQVAASIGFLALAGSRVRADVTPVQVDAAVDKAVAHLLATQKADGSWDAAKPAGAVQNSQWGGETAIATYALLAAHEDPIKNTKLKKAIDFLENNDIHGTYALSLRAQIWRFLANGKVRDAARDRDLEFILLSRIQRGKNAGFYGYFYGTQWAPLGQFKSPLDPKGSPEGAGFDRSTSQYGVLAAWGLEQAGAEIPSEYWKQEDATWTASQNADGGWNYHDGPSTYRMTSAGIATLFLTQDYLLRGGSHPFTTCNGGTSSKAIDKGLAWMDTHIGEAFSNGDGFAYYGLYGIERIGVASGRKYFGTVDWYKTGSEKLVKTQAADGGWGAAEPHDTAFGILFLVHGRAPVLLNKLKYEVAGKKQVDPWNERPRDVANFTKWMSKPLDKTFLNWQIVNLTVPADELHDAPVLFMAGSEEPDLSDQDVAKLRQFVDQGGMILGSADCGTKAFSTGFQKLGNKLFPKYEFRKLPATHPIFTNQMFFAKAWKTHPAVEAMSNGVREIMILIPDADVGRAWQTESFKIREESFQLGADIILYATGKQNLFAKGDTYIIRPDGAAGREIKVGRLELGDNWDPEPGAWPRLSAFLHNTRKVDVKVETVKLGAGALGSYKIVALTGTTKIVLSDAQRKELSDYVTKGGTLIVDAAGGSPEFATAAELELGKAFGDAGSKGLANPLPQTSPIYTDPAGKLDQVQYRANALRLIVGGARQGHIRGIDVGGRIGVYFSREDLTAGCVGEPVDGIIGYTPETATHLMANIVMAADKGAAPIAAAK